MVEELDDIGMIERSNGFDFAPKPRLHGVDFTVDELDRARRVGRDVPTAKDAARSSYAEKTL